MKLISQGAEAKIFRKKSSLLKDRIRKSYRIKEIDEKLRKSRTRREARILEKLAAIGFSSPKLADTDSAERIEMQYIEGSKLRDALDDADYITMSKEIGRKVATLHNISIIHGDLTTSNMIFNREIYFIDFGLSFFSKRHEDKAVDLHLLRQALESKHHKIWDECFAACIGEYKKYAEESEQVLQRLEEVESRGRNKLKH
ncbi:Kae1-associated serine/threonine protein kinase [Candidatus Woesearchaeota archaeon]|nr:Kae1-associated serine/threonine protein kinase [Candidatus Woesearchaeota archaeon]